MADQAESVPSIDPLDLITDGVHLRKASRNGSSYLVSLPGALVHYAFKPARDGAYYLKLALVDDSELKLTQPWVTGKERLGPMKQAVTEEEALALLGLSADDTDATKQTEA